MAERTKRHQKHPRPAPEQDPVRPKSDEQSGSAGRDPGPPSNNPGVDGEPGTGNNTGQGNYGQSGYGQGGYSKGGDAAPTYQKDVAGRNDASSHKSNRGSGLSKPGDEENTKDPSQSD